MIATAGAWRVALFLFASSRSEWVSVLVHDHLDTLRSGQSEDFLFSPGGRLHPPGLHDGNALVEVIADRAGDAIERERATTEQPVFLQSSWLPADNWGEFVFAYETPFFDIFGF
jgi:hypothetical protein